MLSALITPSFALHSVTLKGHGSVALSESGNILTVAPGETSGARAASGHATAAPPRSVKGSRRLN